MAMPRSVVPLGGLPSAEGLSRLISQARTQAPL